MQPSAAVGEDMLASLTDARTRFLETVGVPDVSVEQLISAVEGGNLSPDGGQDVLVRMQAELQRALAKPMNERHWAMVIDLRKCVGCSACTIACVAENKLPPGVVYRPVIDEEVGTFPNVSRHFLPRPCMHCDDPPCTPVCPVAATWKREDGIVVIDYDACIGCRYCITACPYNARTFDFGAHYTDGAAEGTDFLVGRELASAYESTPSYEYGKTWTRAGDDSPIGNARKCHFCAHRLDVGMLPECVSTCIGRATYFGDRNDPDSLVHELIGLPNVIRLKAELGTEPQVHYLL
jgi:molybdopterin-containing oxidoreductase family iron-sulfur binding subunit